MSLDINGTRFLAGLVETAKPEVPGFWLSFFPRTFTFDTEEILFDQVTVDRKLAPFVMPTVSGVAQRDRAFSTDRHKPAYVKPWHVLNPSRTLPRLPGEPLNGTLSPDARRAKLMASYFLDQRTMIERRWNWMAAQVILTGAVVLSGESYPTTTVDFARAAGHTITLGSGSRWGESGVKALDNLETWRKLVFDATGFPVDTIIMGTSAWAAFRADTDLRALMDLFRGTGSVRLGNLDIGPNSGMPLEYKGNDGQCTYWVYSESYDTDETTTVSMMDPRDVVLIASQGFAGAKCYGAILDIQSLMAQALFAKTWVEQNPSVQCVMTQSAPMMVPGRVNCSLKARVLG